jgi:hypothetical protein
LSASVAQAASAWDETVNGDLSNDRLNPTAVSLGLGSNTLSASSVGGTNIDREYVRVGVPAGGLLSQLVLTAYASTDPLSFIGVQSGSTFTEPPTGTNVANLYGYTHFGPGALGIGANYLPAIGTGAGAQGFTPPLAAGNYTFWIQQTSSTAPTTYTFDFVVVPEPGVLALLAVASLALTSVRRGARETCWMIANKNTTPARIRAGVAF